MRQNKAVYKGFKNPLYTALFCLKGSVLHNIYSLLITHSSNFALAIDNLVSLQILLLNYAFTIKKITRMTEDFDHAPPIAQGQEQDKL